LSDKTGVRGLADDYDVVIAGGGIAALTGGLFSARLGHSTLVLAGAAPGGLLLSIEQIEGVPAFPDGVPGYELCPIAQEQAEAAGAELSPDELESLEADNGGWRVNGHISAKAVILATGGRLRELGVPGEERLRGSGVSHCASCDAPLLREKVAGVIGGGDSACQEALTLAGSLSQVLILCREDALSAQETYRARVAEHPKIEVRHGVVVEEILGDSKVTGVRTADGEEIALDAVFVYVGLAPNSAAVADLLSLDAGGHVPTDQSLQTELPGLFAAGIVRAGAAGQAAGSAGDGAAAAKAASRHLANGGASHA
jgi:thioredoxin reductase (NADPH)